MDKIEIGIFLQLFVRSGYVLDLSTQQFDTLTLEAVGEALCEKYRLSKGKSLQSYLLEAPEDKAYHLLEYLMRYYESSSIFENETRDTEPLFGDFDNPGAYRKQYLRCKELLDAHSGVDANETRAAIIEQTFNTQYMREHIRIMIETQDKVPAEAIGKAKELIESCCRTILKENNVPYTKDDGVNDLASKAFQLLKLMPKDVDDNNPYAADLRSVFGSLKGMVRNISNLRNAFGTGHGREADFVGLESRHAHLIVGASISIVEFLWASYEAQKAEAEPKSEKLF